VRRDGTEIDLCPCHDPEGLGREAIELYLFAEMGHLPRRGGVYDQPERLLEMIEAVGQERPRKHAR